MSFLSAKTDWKPSDAGYSNQQKSKADPWGNLSSAAGGAAAPDDAPDVTDKLVRQRRAAAAYQALTGRGRGSTMITSGASPTVGSAGLGKTLLGGG